MKKISASDGQEKDTSHLSDEQIERYHANLVSVAEYAQYSQHLAQCSYCRGERGD